MRQWYFDGHAVIVSALAPRNAPGDAPTAATVAAALWIVYKPAAYYASSSDEKKLRQKIIRKAVKILERK